MTRGRLVIHAHFYQPFRADPFSGRIPPEPSAAPFHDWNARINAECYRPNAERGNLALISYDLGPTLASWLATEDPVTHRLFVEAAPGNAMAQAFHHTILPLAAAHDRRTEILWGIRDFEVRFGRRPSGMWLPETAVDTATLRACTDAGIRYTILAPWQAAEAQVDAGRPYRVPLDGGRDIVVAFYDAALSGAVSFEPAATANADRFARERVATRLAGLSSHEDGAPVIVIATDGELYGHHQQFRDLFLQRLLQPEPDTPDRGFDVVGLASVLEDADSPLPLTRVRDRTSWSCHHGVARWSTECPDAADGRWKGPLRAALERLAAGIDALTDDAATRLRGQPDLWAARDEYVDVILGVEPETSFAARWLGEGAPPEDRALFGVLMLTQRWRLAMFASDGWYWDDPIRFETKQVLRAAARSARLVDTALGARLESRLVADLELLVSPSTHLDGAAIYREALAEVDQPPPTAGGE